MRATKPTIRKIPILSEMSHFIDILQWIRRAAPLSLKRKRLFARRPDDFRQPAGGQLLLTTSLH
jgi:hypothetical protein